jgi:uncharacterized membrane protein YciS (DUF1049 family)
MRIFIFIVLISLTLLLKSQEKVSFPYWLEGTWEISSEMGVSYEKWEITGDSLMFGKTFRYFAHDTIVFDTMKIKTNNDVILFEMAANIQNTRVVAGFVLSQPTPELWKFENQITDSPHNINYWRINDEKVYVWIETMNLDDACMDFVMIRKNE